MSFTIPKELYSKDVLFKTCYKFTDEYYVHLSSNIDSYIIDIEPKDGKSNTTSKKLFKNELIEQTNRTLIFEETKNLREMLYARALSSSMIIAENPTSVIDTNVNDSTANRDWFNE